MAQRFGEFLVEEGYILPSQLEEGLEMQRQLQKVPIGEVIVELGLIQQIELPQILARHLHTLWSESSERLLFGEYLIDSGILEQEDLERALWHQAQLRKLRIGEVLVRLGYLQPHQLREAIDRQLGAVSAL